MLIIRWLGQACFLLWTLTGPHLLIDPPSPQVSYHITIDGPQASAVVGPLHPRVILPMHYRTAALKPDLRAKLAPPDAFLAAMKGKAQVIRISARDLKLSPQTLPLRYQ